MNEIEKAELAKTTVQCFTGLKGSLDNFPALLKKVIEERAWERRLHNGRLIELSSLRDLVTLRPLEGWGQNPAKIEAVIKDNPEVLAMWREEMKGEPGRKDETDNNVIPLDTPQGNSKSYTLSRLKRENAELFNQVVAGELSANAAAIKAGWRKVKSPLEQLNHLWSRASEKERAEFSAKMARVDIPKPKEVGGGMNCRIYKHFDQTTPFSEASNDDEMAQIMVLRYPKACSGFERGAMWFNTTIEEIIKAEAWKYIGFDSFEAFCKDKLSDTFTEVEGYIQRVKRLGGMAQEEGGAV